MKLIGIVLVAVTSVAVAQRTSRAVFDDDTGYDFGVDVMFLPGSGVVSIEPRPIVGAPSTLVSGITLPGALYVFGDASVLLSGADAVGNGRLEYWSQSNAGYALLSSKTDSTVDYAGIAYDPLTSRLFLLDAKQKELLQGPWSPGNSLGGLSLTTLATSGVVPDLLNAEDRFLDFVASSPSESEFVFCKARPVDLNVGVAIPIATPSGFYSRYSPRTSMGSGASGTAREVWADAGQAAEGDSVVTVHGPVGAHVEVVNVASNTVIGAAIVSAGHTSVQVSVNPALTIGTLFGAREHGTTAFQDTFECVRRYVNSATLADGTTLGGRQAPFFSAIGQEHLPSVPLVAASAPAVPVSHSGFLVVAPRQGAQDPVVFSSGQWLLTGGAWLPATGYVLVDGTGSFSGKIVIPNDAQLVGTVWLTQFMISDGASYVPSDILGFVVR